MLLQCRNNKYKTLKLFFIMPLFLILTACAEATSDSSSYDISLLNGNTPPPAIKPNPKLTIQVSDKFQNPQFIGGEDYAFRTMKFHDIVSWLKSRVININSLDCVLTKKINLKIDVKKLYTTLDGDVCVGALVLNVRMTAANGKTLIRSYRGDCKIGDFSFKDNRASQSCFNSALDIIVSDLKHDICELNKMPSAV